MTDTDILWGGKYHESERNCCMLNCTENFVLDTRYDSSLFEEGVGVYDFNFYLLNNDKKC